MRRKPLALLALLTVVLIAAGVGWRWRGGQPAAEGQAAKAGGPAPQAVGVVLAQQRDVPVVVEASGTVSALNQVDIRAQTTTTVREVLVKEGQMVAKGQLLFRFDDRADRASLEKARAQLARDRASLADLERQYQRAQELLAQNFVTQSAVDTARANLDAGRGLVQADEAAVQAAAVSTGYNELRAPLAGRAGAVNVWPGGLVQPSATATPLLNIVQIDPVGVSFTLPESQLPPILDAMQAAAGKPDAAPVVEVVPPVEEGASRGGRRNNSAAPAGERPRGRLVFVDNQVDASTGTIKVKAQFDNPRQQLWPGQYVRVRMTLRTLKDAVVVPQAAIILRGNDRQLYTVDEQNQAQLRPVKLRYTFGEQAVVDGVPAGARVVVDGKQNLRPGTPVREQPAAANPAAATRAASGASA